MRVIVTGVAGFIGSNLAERLINEGHSVLGIDNFSHGNIKNVDGIINNDNFKLLTHDLTNKPVLESADVIVHLASEKIPRYDNAYNTLDRNHKMIESVTEMAGWNHARLIFSSTSDVYGKNETAPFSEETPLVLGNTDVKRWAYAVSKIHSEQYIIACHDKFDMDYTIIRFFSCYGKNQGHGWWGGVQSAFIQNVLLGNEIEIHGSGMQSRCFTYIDDAVDGIMLCLTKDEAKNQIFNIGNPASYVTVYGLSKLVFSITNKAVPIRYVPYSELGKYEDAKIKIPDITKAKTLLGYSPKWNLLDGLSKTIKWQEEEYKLY